MDEELRLLERYAGYLADIRRYSPHTVRAYRQDIGQFLAYFRERRLPVERSHVRDFLAHVFLRSRKKATVARKVYAVRSFYAWLVASGLRADNPLEGIATPKLEKRVPQALSEPEMAAFLDALPEEPFLALRNKAAFELLYATGLRVSELAGLNRDDLRPGERLLRVMGKGRKERIVPFHAAAGALLGRYLAERQRRFPAAGDAVLVNARGGRLSARSLERILAQTFRQLSSSATRVHPHLFRHSFASHLLQRGANLRVIQELLGHANLATTEKYTALDYSDLLRTYRRFHPRQGS